MSMRENQNLNENLNIYCQSESLLFQFILSEFLITYQKVNEIEKTYYNMEAFLIKKRLEGNISEYLDLILAYIPFLTGAHMGISDEPTFPWTHSKGSLNKLRHYCYLFSQKSTGDQDIENMNICISKAFHSALQMREVILSLMRQSKEGGVPNYISLYQFVDKLLDNMRKASRLILKILMLFKEDENILLFLLKYQSDFDEIYKTQFVLKILNKMYPKGIRYAKDLLIEKYAKRGFSNLLESISNQMSNLETTSLTT